MNRKEKKMFIGLLIIAVLIGAFSINQYTIYVKQKQEENAQKAVIIQKQEVEAQEQKRIEEEARVKAEEEARLKAEEEAKLKAEADKSALEISRQGLISENSYYVGKKSVSYYDQHTEPKNELGTLKLKTPVFVSEYISDGAASYSYVQIKDSYEGKVLGYVPFDDLVKDIAAFIARPYEDVDYSAFVKVEGIINNPRVNVKGIYMTGHSASNSKLDELIDLLNRTELNAVVIDVKDDNGFLLFYSDTADQFNPEANKKVYIKDMPAFIKKMKDNNIYLIARIVTFKSPIYARTNPDKAIIYKDSGELYSDSDRLLWASPHNRDLWAYNVGVAKEAAAWGFNEIQFDYVRFPAIANKERIDYRNPENESQAATIQKFIKYAYGELSSEGVYIAADVFGWAATSINDVGIGQHWEAVTNVADYICPMMYPSHYGPNNFGLSVPDAFPYETIDRSLKDAFERNSNVQTPARIRPWIQDFTASWVKGHISYGANELAAQIKALNDNGITEYLIWNAKNNYSEEALLPEE